jgi:6,7-dimethyl-8-ribityllumazine synthase
VIPGEGPAGQPMKTAPSSADSVAPSAGASGDLLPPGLGVAVVVSRYNDQVTGRLLDGAVATLVAAGVPRERIEVAWVPGAFELPFIADVLAASGRHAAVLCLGAIIRGETTHDQHIARAVAGGIEAVARQRGLPVLFGVLTCDSLAQAFARAGVASAPAAAAAARAGGADGESKKPVENKGAECAAAALDMIALVTRLRGAAAPPQRA